MSIQNDIAVEDDSLYTPEIGAWGEQKYNRLQNYVRMFTKAMRKKWSNIVYVDLFSGAGHAQIRNSDRFVKGSPLIALNSPDQFKKYIFCDNDPRSINALKERVMRQFPSADVTYINEDINSNVDAILDSWPNTSSLGFCFCDPWKIKSLNFATIRKLASLRLDFLILLPTGMDANRNWWKYYIKNDNSTISQFLGHDEWRKRWEIEEPKNPPVELFFANEILLIMKELNYIINGDIWHVIRSTTNQQLYHLGFFSKHPLGVKFWEAAKTSGPTQQELF